ncbi:hypothetical protein PFICI_09671 [Pestalotiopsis fici W106-1]|uniref:Aminotransferase class I/classII large domain-containing protein n=1 Tax=Pestalotiopsis fici (strain W106-1 / CGMCC3.15140) TaxID=1229662 RepID=W3WUW9_PESFW|nr:uncharacterized protein PFICI_09671 [Pestalotiopsis fici W106-1]ETS77609.1 hypothetical protein PFICI_09671 [Pestalotiopsis fici W106-1]
MQGYGLSARGAANVDAVWPRISKAATEREHAEQPCIDLATSENWLIRKELIDFYKKAVQDGLSDRHLSYQNGLAGDTDLLEALVGFFNSYFRPCIPVTQEHLSTAPGSTFCLDSLLYNTCEAGDGLLILTPCWSGFDWLVSVKSGVQPVFVTLNNLEGALTLEVIPALEAAFSSSPHPVKALLFTNPNNPIGQCYPVEVIKDVIRFCNQRKIHLISDEIYALSSFQNPELKDPTPFVSILELDIKALGCDPSRVHMIWSTSKDLGSSGMRMGCCVTQKNRPLATGLALTSTTQMSCLTAIATASLLKSPELPRLLELNSQRLADAYQRTTAILKSHGLPYIPVNHGPFVFFRIDPNAQTSEEEAKIIQKCKQAGVTVSAGRSYHLPEAAKGWARMNFAIAPGVLDEALGRFCSGLECRELNSS